MNVVMTSEGRFVEVQGTAERGSFDDEALEAMISSARRGIRKLFKMQELSLRRAGKAKGKR
jgi:ribonuclease PH